MIILSKRADFPCPQITINMCGPPCHPCFWRCGHRGQGVRKDFAKSRGHKVRERLNGVKYESPSKGRYRAT